MLFFFYIFYKCQHPIKENVSILFSSIWIQIKWQSLKNDSKSTEIFIKNYIYFCFVHFFFFSNVNVTLVAQIIQISTQELVLRCICVRTKYALFSSTSHLHTTCFGLLGNHIGKYIKFSWCIEEKWDKIQEILIIFARCGMWQ